MEHKPLLSPTCSPNREGQELGPGWMLLLHAEMVKRSLVTALISKQCQGRFPGIDDR